MAARRAPHLALVESGASRPDLADLRRLLLAVHRLAAPFDGAALGMVGFGLLLATLDIVVPLGAGWIVDAMAGEQPFVQVACLIGAVALVVWVPHGNLSRWLLARYDAKHYRP